MALNCCQNSNKNESSNNKGEKNKKEHVLLGFIPRYSFLVFSIIKLCYIFHKSTKTVKFCHDMNSPIDLTKCCHEINSPLNLTEIL